MIQFYPPTVEGQEEAFATPEPRIISYELTGIKVITGEDLPPPRVLDVFDEIKALEAANPITHRNLRDLSMTVAQIAAAVTGGNPLDNPAVKQILELEAKIADLRAKL